MIEVELYSSCLDLLIERYSVPTNQDRLSLAYLEFLMRMR
jgi:hypothetical protein